MRFSFPSMFRLAAVVVITACLVVDALSLPDEPWERSVVGSILGSPLSGRGTHCSSALAAFQVVRKPDGSVLLLPPPTTAAVQSLPVIGYAELTFSRASRGFWAPTVSRFGYTWWVSSVSGAPVAPADRRQIDAQAINVWTDAAAQGLVFALDAEKAAAITTGNSMRTAILWTGVAHDCVSLFFAAAAVVLVIVEVRGVRLRRRDRAGMCESCGYDLSGASPSAAPVGPLRSLRCPECGAVYRTYVPASAPAPSSASSPATSPAAPAEPGASPATS